VTPLVLLPMLTLHLFRFTERVSSIYGRFFLASVGIRSTWIQLSLRCRRLWYEPWEIRDILNSWYVTDELSFEQLCSNEVLAHPFEYYLFRMSYVVGYGFLRLVYMNGAIAKKQLTKRKTREAALNKILKLLRRRLRKFFPHYSNLLKLFMVLPLKRSRIVRMMQWM
jgi:hypothetical protein